MDTAKISAAARSLNGRKLLMLSGVNKVTVKVERVYFGPRCCIRYTTTLTESYLVDYLERIYQKNGITEINLLGSHVVQQKLVFL